MEINRRQFSMMCTAFPVIGLGVKFPQPTDNWDSYPESTHYHLWYEDFDHYQLEQNPLAIWDTAEFFKKCYENTYFSETFRVRVPWNNGFFVYEGIQDHLGISRLDRKVLWAHGDILLSRKVILNEFEDKTPVDWQGWSWNGMRDWLFVRGVSHTEEVPELLKPYTYMQIGAKNKFSWRTPAYEELVLRNK